MEIIRYRGHANSHVETRAKWTVPVVGVGVNDYLTNLITCWPHDGGVMSRHWIVSESKQTGSYLTEL